MTSHVTCHPFQDVMLPAFWFFFFSCLNSLPMWLFSDSSHLSQSFWKLHLVLLFSFPLRLRPNCWIFPQLCRFFRPDPCCPTLHRLLWLSSWGVVAGNAHRSPSLFFWVPIAVASGQMMWVFREAEHLQLAAISTGVLGAQFWKSGPKCGSKWNPLPHNIQYKQLPSPSCCETAFYLVTGEQGVNPSSALPSPLA